MNENRMSFEELKKEALQLREKLKENDLKLEAELEKQSAELSGEKERDRQEVRRKTIREYRSKEADAINALRDRYLVGAADEIDRRVRFNQLVAAKVMQNSFYLCSEEGFEKAATISRRDIEREWRKEQEVREAKEKAELSELGKKRLRLLKLTQEVDKEIEKIPEEELRTTFETGLITEKSLAYSLLLKGVREEKEFEIPWDYKTFWIGDIVAWRIKEEYGLFPEDDKRYFKETDREGLKEVEHYLAKLREHSPVEWTFTVFNASFTCNQIRERTARSNKNYLSNRQCYELVKKFAGTQIVRKSKRRLLKDGKTWIRCGELDNVCKIYFMETGDISHKTQEPKYDFTAVFDRVNSLDFWLWVRLGLFDYRARSYYRLRGGTQLIIRAVGWTQKQSRLSLEALAKIIGTKDENKSQQQNRIESHLREARDAEYIDSWRKKVTRKGYGGRMSVMYFINKVKKWPTI